MKEMTVSELNDFIIKNYSVDKVKKIIVELEKETTGCDELTCDDKNFLYEGIKLCKENKSGSELEDFFLQVKQRIDENKMISIFFAFLFILLFCICIRLNKYVDLYIFVLEAFKISLSISRKIFLLIYEKLFKSAIDKEKQEKRKTNRTGFHLLRKKQHFESERFILHDNKSLKHDDDFEQKICTEICNEYLNIA